MTTRTSSHEWLPDMDLNHDKQIQSLLCYRYTIGQTSAFNLEGWRAESRLYHTGPLSPSEGPTEKNPH